MGENSKIEWTHHTFNPWIGCQEMSAACDHCYARVMNERWHWVKGWGPHGERKRTSPANWRKPLAWAKAARIAGERRRVFCASLADVFDNQVPVGWRSDLFDLIASTPELDWLLLTKRPENLARMFPTGAWSNIWLGTTCEDQPHYLKRYRLIAELPVTVRFISYEPALGPLSVALAVPPVRAPDWIICGGESGHRARVMPEWWARNVRDDCAKYGIAFFMKQMTGKAEIPADLQIRQFPMPRLAAAA